MQNRLYTIVRNDLYSKGYMAAQSGHAIAEYMIEHAPHIKGLWKNSYLICLQANKDDFEMIKQKLEYFNITHSKFHEPDLNDSLTAIAVLNNCNLFKKLELL